MRVHEAVLFCKVNTTAALLDANRGGIVFGYDESEFVNRIYRENGVPLPQYRGGLNSLTFAYSMLDEIGVDTVILSGQDMCFGSDGETHVIQRPQKTEDRDERFYVTNNLGEKVRSRYDWVQSVEWYENAIFDTNIKRVINTATTGAKVEGTIVMSLGEALEKYGKEHDDISDVVFMAPRVFGDKQDFNTKKIFDEMRHEISDICDTGKYNISDIKKKSRVYDLIYKYYIADEKEDIVRSIEAGVKELSEYLQRL